ncbi:Carbohydrate sulfotransferase 13 [Stylophora pistillata]|uniref:Carbohydrate sulfotransferase n=1 Tax=Stylophora pistillata TaxID=50429 RepID=A0A2B4SYB5_STYPI|nr:Carbohydrate sulfotransferase 13 [Stylophora pistillata]
MDGPGQLLGYRSMQQKVREIHGLNVPRDVVYAMMKEVSPEGLQARGGFKSISPSMSFSGVMTERRQLLHDQWLKKPPNAVFLQQADSSRLIEELKLVFCFIPKVSGSIWKRTLYSAENNGEQLKGVPHNKKLFSWLQDYSILERQKILSTYYKAMFFREPFARLASAYRDKIKKPWFKRFLHPGKTKREIEREKDLPFSAFCKKSY